MKSQHGIETATAAPSDARRNPGESRKKLALALPSALTAAAPFSNWLAWALLLVPILLGFYFVSRFGVNVAWEDDWTIPALLGKHDAGNLTILDFWRQHNEHRHFIPEIVMYLLAFATRWSVVAEMWVIQLMLLFMLAVMLRAFWRECPSPYRIWMMVPIAYLAMSLRQSQNLLFGWQIGFMMIAASAVAAIYCLYRMNGPRLRALKYAAAIAAATVSTLSGGSGPLVWIAGLVPLELLPLSRRSKTILFVSWAILGIAEWTIYFWGYHPEPTHPSIHFSWPHGLEIVREIAGERVVVRAGVGAVLLSLLQYGLTVVGAAMFPALLMAAAAGVIILLLAAAATVLSLTDQDRSKYSFWLGITVFSLLVDGATTFGRAGFGPGQALSARYATFSGLAVIGLYAMLTCLAVEKRSAPVAAMWGCLFSLIATGLVVSTGEAFEIAGQERLAKQYNAFVLSTIETQPDAAIRLANPEVEEIRNSTRLLKKYGWNVFSSGGTAELYVLPPATLPMLSTPARIELSQFGVAKDMDYLMIAGWATTPEGKDLVGGVYIDIDGKLYPAFYGLPRPDVAQVLKTDAVAKCGFQRQLPLSLLTKGRHSLTIKALTKDRGAWFAPQPPKVFDWGT